jgi:hypothetical protein
MTNSAVTIGRLHTIGTGCHNALGGRCDVAGEDGAGGASRRDSGTIATAAPTTATAATIIATMTTRLTHALMLHTPPQAHLEHERIGESRPPSGSEPEFVCLDHKHAPAWAYTAKRARTCRTMTIVLQHALRT